MAKELRIDIVGTATQFGAAAKEALDGLDSVRKAASQSVQVESAAAAKQVADDLGKIKEAAAAAGRSAVKSAATGAKNDLNEVRNAVADIGVKATTGASGAASRAIKEIKIATTGFLSGITGGIVGGGLGAGIAAAGLGAIGQMINVYKEYLRIGNEADKMDVSRTKFVGYMEAGGFIGGGEVLIPNAINSARQARSDAAAGQPEALEAFRNLGLKLKDIEGLSPDRLFVKIADSFKDGDPTNTARRFAASKVLGREAADQLVPYFLGGSDPGRRINFDRIETISPIIGDPEIRKKYRADVEPLSTYGFANEEQARKAQEQNLQRALLIARAQLSTEERTTLAVQERARLLKLIAGEGDPLKKQKLIGDALQVEAELADIDGAGKKVGRQDNGFGQRRSDPLRSFGADLSRFAPTLSTNLQERQISEIRTLRISLETRLRAVETVVRDAL
jgi:hypothetical protein